MNELILKGCTPEPLMSYLKALGILRLVAEQADPNAKGCWRNGTFVLITKLTKESLLNFFVSSYSPTPIVAPWNGGSGFYPGDTSKGIEGLLNSDDNKFDFYKSVIREIKTWVEMPSAYDRVSDVVKALKKESLSLRPGKKLNKYKKMLADIEHSTEDYFASTKASPLDDIKIDDLEKLAKPLEGALKKTASAWWKAVKKARTECVSLERSGEKEAILQACRSRLPKQSLLWIDSVVSIKVDGTPSYNPILGTGGNEGRLDFTNNFMQRLVELFIEEKPERTRRLAIHSFFGKLTDGLWKESIGQFDPGGAGGYNQGTGIEAKDFKINPWDFVMMIEGATILSSSVSKRNDTQGYGWASIPFTVKFSGVGFSSSDHTESGRAETWLPTWSKPTGYKELAYLFAEGRSEVGHRRARTGLDFSRAVGSLGVDRGLSDFVRYTFLERRGTNYVALPSGRLTVKNEPKVRLLDDLDPLISHLDRFIREFPNVPATIESAKRNIDEAIFKCAVNPDPWKFIDLVRALGRMEFLIAQRDRSKKPALNAPLHGLRPEWVMECDNGESEVRVAAALASIHATDKVGGIRCNMAGVDPVTPWKWSSGHGQRRWLGNSLVERLNGVLTQRMMDAERLNARVVPTESFLSISPKDVTPFLSGDTDDRLIEDLLWGFTLVKWKGEGLKMLRKRWSTGLDTGILPRSWCLMKLLFVPLPIRGKLLRMEPRILPLLCAGRTREANVVARRRLMVSNLKPLPIEDSDWINHERQSAALLIPTMDIGLLESLTLKKRTEV